MIVVSDTSPVSNLFIIGRLELLHLLFGEVIIPLEVHHELLQLSKSGLDVSVFQNSAWIKIQSCANHQAVTALMKELDRGEAEAIQLALELKANVLLIDELKGRTVAQRKGLVIIGLIGVLVEAKREKMIPLLKPVFEQLRVNAKFRIKEDIIRQILKQEGE